MIKAPLKNSNEHMQWHHVKNKTYFHIIYWEVASKLNNYKDLFAAKAISLQGTNKKRLMATC